MIAQRRIFESVFPPSTKKPAPTPQATPVIGAGSFRTSQDVEQETAKSDQSWIRATDFLSLPDKSITLEDARRSRDGLPATWVKQPSQNTPDAILLVLNANASPLPSGQDLYAWYTQEMSRHYLELELPLILKCLTGTNPLESVLSLFQTIQLAYLNPLVRLELPNQKLHQQNVRRLQESLHSLVSTSLRKSVFSKILEDQVMLLARTFFGLLNDTQQLEEDQMQIDNAQEASDAELGLKRLLTVANHVGLGGALAQRILAEVLSKILAEFVEKNYAGHWSSPSRTALEISDWIDDSFMPFIAKALNCLESSTNEQDDGQFVFYHDTEAWKTRATNELGALRLKQLFNLIVSWDDSRGAIEDLKYYLTSPNARAHVTTQFSEELSRRLLQPGASTSQILDLYIRLIQAFTVLDPRGVLLDRIARPVRRYLREREDTVKLIVGGLLADSSDKETQDPLSILALKLEEAAQTSTEEDAELDWDDMNWVPDPIDAEPEYKKSKSSDIIGNLISLFETRDVFVKEFQNILGERLLQVKDDFEAETRLLELLKIRFGEGPLQSCEVMLRDVYDSARTDSWVRREQGMDSSMDISTKVLSRLYWPALHTETFKLPPDVEKLQKAYSDGFEKYKTSRKLTWLDVLGEVTVELELEDRTINEIVKTPQAALIHAFASEASSAVRKTAEQLVEELQMDEDLVETCLLFWVGKLVLFKAGDGTYSVLERLPKAAKQEASLDQAAKSSTLAAAAKASATAAAAPVSALRSEEDIAEEKMQVYWQFIVGMLTNQGAMPLARIVMMLKLAMAGGFPYSNEELRTFLGKKVDDGKLELAGGSYKLIRGAN